MPRRLDAKPKSMCMALASHHTASTGGGAGGASFSPAHEVPAAVLLAHGQRVLAHPHPPLLPPRNAGYMGAPTVGLEKLDSDQAEAALRGALEALRAAESDTAPGGSTGAGGAGASARVEGQGAAVAIAGARAAEAIAGTPAGTADALCSGAATLLAAVMAGEVGGGNGVEPLVVGARLGLPVVDGDLMGRAFPELQASRCGLSQPAPSTAPEHLWFCVLA